ncbi:MAG: hypothetical protein M3Y48_17445 [Actinomycetota bacterium]|nr:hypothetical protein [Actinomycetota bacterium]
MTAGLALTPTARTIRRLDALVVALVLVFAGLGVVAGLELTRLAGFSTSLLDAAKALDQIGHTLNVLARLPFVGRELGPAAASVQQTAASTRSNAVDAAASVHVVAMVLGVAIAAVPLLPLLSGYLPLRIARFTEIRRLRRLLAAPPVDPQLVAYLAHGAVSRLPYTRLQQITRDPWGDLAAGRHHGLATAELQRLGVAPPPDWQAEAPRLTGRRQR